MSARSHAKVLALSGGVGGAKLAAGLAGILHPGELTVLVNTGDDFEHLGLHVSPDIDSVVYALSGRNDIERGWGRADETWQFMGALRELAGDDWFRLGDRDLAMHVLRTQALRQGEALSALTARAAAALGIRSQVVPMTDAPVRTLVHTDEGALAFQEYFVRRKCVPRVTGLCFEGVQRAMAPSAVLALLRDPALAAVVLCPSNPFLSIDPILAVPGLRDALSACEAPVVAVSPIIGGAAVKGPTAKILRELGHEVSPAAIAEHYAGLLDGIVIDEEDRDLRARIAIATCVTRTLMTRTDERASLARSVLDFAATLRDTPAIRGDCRQMRQA
ncbi:MAG TPA: 2-phospho-L-lactate transferase [Casimicrobiaceae bacterium]|nr:2-phospho-L-lactate transferase [Casimicrobiaceae bacterium]